MLRLAKNGNQYNSGQHKNTFLNGSEQKGMNKLTEEDTRHCQREAMAKGAEKHCWSKQEV